MMVLTKLEVAYLICMTMCLLNWKTVAFEVKDSVSFEVKDYVDFESRGCDDFGVQGYIWILR